MAAEPKDIVTGELHARVARLEAANAAKDAALRDTGEDAHSAYMDRHRFPKTQHSGRFMDCPTALCTNRRAALSDAGEGLWPYRNIEMVRQGWLPPNKAEEARQNIRLIDASPAGSANAQFKAAALAALEVNDG